LLTVQPLHTTNRSHGSQSNNVPPVTPVSADRWRWRDPAVRSRPDSW
jgi:hypothetical protein